MIYCTSVLMPFWVLYFDRTHVCRNALRIMKWRWKDRSPYSAARRRPVASAWMLFGKRQSSANRDLVFSPTAATFSVLPAFANGERPSSSKTGLSGKSYNLTTIEYHLAHHLRLTTFCPINPYNPIGYEVQILALQAKGLIPAINPRLCEFRCSDNSLKPHYVNIMPSYWC